MQVLLPGTQVSARGLRWEVVYSHPAGENLLYRLRCLDGGLQGTEFDLLSPFEKVEPLATELEPEKAAPLAAWRLYMQAFLLEQALGPNALLAAQPGRLSMQPYQLVPVMRALRMSRPRLLLADGVGLGKTIQAGLVMAELLARRRAHRILIISPAGPLLEQWRLEMRERFGLRFDVLDRSRLQEIQYQNELGTNPFDHVALGLMSIDFAKQEKVLQYLERANYDLVILDEAHHVMSLGAIGDLADSQRRRLAEVVSRQCDALLLLTATPHDGHDPHFASIVELLDPSLVDGRGSLRGESYRKHVVRRLKRHIKDPKTGEDLFKKREVRPIRVAFDAESHPDFTDFQEGLLALIAPQLKRAMRSRKYGDVLAFIALLKRSVSTVKACRNTLEAISSRLNQLIEKGTEEHDERKQRLKTLRDYRRRMDRFGVLSPEEEQDKNDLEAEDMAAELLAHGAEELAEKLADLEREARRERRKLGKKSKIQEAINGLLALSEDAALEDPKLVGVLDAILEIREAKPEANILVYTEYTDSQAAVVAFLMEAIKKKKLSGSILAISGDDDEKTRISTTERFRSLDNLILVSTDASAEGLNLHDRCHHLVHVELPYNPNRLEQRNGRIDRFGQKHNPKVSYLYLGGTFEERLLIRLIGKWESQRTRLTFVPNTLGVSLNDPKGIGVKLLDGVAEDGPTLFKKPEQPQVFDAEEHSDLDNPAYSELLDEMDKVFSSFEKAAKTHNWLDKDGLGAEEKDLSEADQARAASKKQGVTDLAQFVVTAAKMDLPSGSVTQSKEGIWEMRLSGNWTWDLEDTPGFDSQKRLLRVTTDADKLKDEDGNPVGYLGRAHPVVRRALDRVRNIQFGGDKQLLDRRVSAAKHDGGKPELLVTFLGRVQSGAGREFERVVAVQIGKGSKPKAFANPSEWEDLASMERAIDTGKLWEKHYKPWGMDSIEKAKKAASGAFEPLAADFLKSFKEDRANEATELDQWLAVRAQDICGKTVMGVQQELVPAPGKKVEAPLPSWQTLEDPLERLASFATDSGNSPKERSEAQTVISLYKARTKDLEARSQTEVAPVEVLGMLMLVPEKDA